MKRMLLLASCLLAFAAVPATAEDANVVRYDMQYVNAAGVVLATDTYTAPFGPPFPVACGQVAPTVPATVVNPTRIFFDDVPASAGVCIATLNTATVAALPSGTGYTVTVTATDALGQVSPRSAASNPFSRQVGPNVRTGVKVVP